jgi:hypothetical protein
LTSFACPQRRIEKVQAWLAAPNLLEVDKDAVTGNVIEIDMKLKKKRPRERFRGRFVWGAQAAPAFEADLLLSIHNRRFNNPYWTKSKHT